MLGSAQCVVTRVTACLNARLRLAIELGGLVIIFKAVIDLSEGFLVPGPLGCWRVEVV